MPINLKKFEQIVTEHFATVTDEEFLENLRKSSPYLFIENSEATKDLQISDTSALNSNNCHSIIDRQNIEENKIDRYREFVKSLISNYANSDISNEEVEVQLVLDADRDHYQWMNVGWQGSDRIYRCVMHFDIKDGKIWLQQNLTDRDPAEELVNMGVPKGEIVLGLQMPSKRPYADYGVA
jgi:XisI protein